jgi:hypothetical protein
MAPHLSKLTAHGGAKVAAGASALLAAYYIAKLVMRNKRYLRIARD